MRIIRTLISAATVAMLPAGAVPAQDWAPQGNLSLHIPFAAGGSTDTMGRVLAQAIEDATGWNVIAENRTGGGGVAMFTAIANMPANGQVVGIGVNEPILINLATRGDELNFDLDSFDYIGSFARGYLAALAATDAPFDDIAGAVEYVRENGPIAVSIEAAGQRALVDAIAEHEGIAFNYVTSSGASESLRMLLGGQVQMAFASGEELPYLASGDMKIIASAGPNRVAHSPDAMTFIESGYDVYVDPVWYLAVAAGTDPAALQVISAALEQAVQDPRVTEIVRNLTGSDPVNLGSEGTRQLMVEGLENARRAYSE